jgi:hypothetical protein
MQNKQSSTDSFDGSGLSNNGESTPNKSDTVRRYQPNPVLTAIFVVHFIGHPRSGSEIVCVFLKEDIEDLIVQLRSHFDLPEGIIPRVSFEGNQESCTFSDICSAAKGSSQLLSLAD